MGREISQVDHRLSPDSRAMSRQQHKKLHQSNSRSLGKARSGSPPRESKRKKSSHRINSISKLPPIPNPPAAHFGSSYSWDSAQGQALLDRVAQRAESGPEARVDGSAPQNRDAPYLALVQLFNQFQGTPVDTKKKLVSVSVLGSTGPLRMLVTSEAKVKDLIQMSLLKYAHEGRVPSLGRNVAEFELYESQFSSQALSHEDRIAEAGTRNFVLCPRKNMRSNGSCAKESKASDRSSKSSWWSYVTGITSLV